MKKYYHDTNGFLSRLHKARKNPSKRLKGFITFKMYISYENFANMIPASPNSFSMIIFLEEYTIFFSLKSRIKFPSLSFSAILVVNLLILSYSQFSYVVFSLLNVFDFGICFFAFSIVTFL